MELKPSACSRPPEPNLLIVPYGIETAKLLGYNAPVKLLIVPYGIETNHNIYRLSG